MKGNVSKASNLKMELSSLNKKYKQLHFNLIKAENDGDENEVKILLSKIQQIAEKQSRIKQALNGIRWDKGCIG